MEKLFALSIMICLVVVGIYFFNKDKLSGNAFTAFVLGLIILFISFYSIDRLKEFNITGMRLVLSEMRDTKSNFDERVNMILEILAELNIDYTANQGFLRLEEEPDTDKLLKARELSMQLLELSGKSKEEIEKQTSIIDTEIIRKYLRNLSDNIAKTSSIFNNLDPKHIEDRKTVLGQKIHSYNKGQATDIDSLVKFLESEGIEQDLYKGYVSDMIFYLKEHAVRNPKLIQ